MKLWYDACTGKHVRYGTAIAKRLREMGHEVVLTTRSHPDTVRLARYLGEEVHVVGKYDPSTKLSRLQESLRRQMLLYAMFRDDPPDLAVSHQSVELCRVAFGLGIPIILTHDSPHAEAVNRLTIPLSDALVVSKAIPQESLLKYGVRRIQTFDGVDEVAWMKDFDVKGKFDYGKPLIVVRQMETRAAYAGSGVDLTEKFAEDLTELGRVVFLSRYGKKLKKGVVTPRSFVDSVSLVAQADLVVGVGGTIAREAALMGTPSIVVPVFGHSYVNNYLSRMGFPLYIVGAEKVLEYAKRYIGRRFDVKLLLERLEDPIEVIHKLVEELGS